MSENVSLPNAPSIPGLTFRHFRGEADYPHMAALISACKVADGVERSTNVDDIARTYRHLENCDPQTDMLFAEVEGQVIAYGRVWWDDLLDGVRLYHPFGFLHPDWRGNGIGTAMWEAGERRAREIAAGHPKETPKFLQVEPFESEKGLVALLERRGYRPARYETYMVRDLSEPFSEAPMPPGLEVRPVKLEHLRHIFEASNEAFRDHWGSRDVSEEGYKAEMEDPNFHPELWKVAWDGDQMASVIHNFVDEKENVEYQRKRGYTEGICTRRPWRKLGLARSLLVQSMQMFKEMGMTETARSVDSENLSGAFHLYEGVGYRKVKQQINYRKPME
ncbi:MAG TPA: GNAT family N-acetyltransferase [Anaerolineales bacterium]